MVAERLLWGRIMSEPPEWTPEDQEIIDYWHGLDKVSSAIGGYMMLVTSLPLTTIRKLLSFTEIECHDEDTSGAQPGVLVFRDIHSPHPRVEYIANKGVGDNVRLSPDRCVIPLQSIFFLIMNLAKGVQ